jgi:DNA-directed RNA polymerase specialized sigma24 family protein
MTHDASNEWVTTSTVLQGLSDFDSHWLFRIVQRRIDYARRKGDQRAANVSMQPAETGAWMRVEAPEWTSPEWEEVWERELGLTRNATSIAEQRFSDGLRELIEPSDEVCP